MAFDIPAFIRSLGFSGSEGQGYILSSFDDFKNAVQQLGFPFLTVKENANTAFTLSSDDNSKVILTTAATAVTVTLPNNRDIGFNVAIIQHGAGAVSFSAASGATLQNGSGHTGISAQYGIVSLLVAANSDGASAIYNLSGSTA